MHRYTPICIRPLYPPPPAHTCTHHSQEKKIGEEVGAVVYRADTHCVLLEGPVTRTPNGRGFYYYYIYRLTHDQTPPKGGGFLKRWSAKKYRGDKMGNPKIDHPKIKEARKLLNNYVNNKGDKLAYNNPYLMAVRIAVYIATCKENERPLTETGLAVALRIFRPTLKKYMNGEMDYIVLGGYVCRENEADIKVEIDQFRKSGNKEAKMYYDYITDYDDEELLPSEVVGRARQLVSMEREERLMSKGRVGDIYTMKAREGKEWREDEHKQDKVVIVGNNNALEALKQLGYKKG